MRWLTQRNDDRGASAVLFALCLVVLVGFVGLGVDVTASYAKDQEMQHAADSAALAVAQECAKQETCTPSSHAGLAAQYASGNAIDAVTPVLAAPSSGSQLNSVRVVTESTRQNWFLPIFGLDETAVGAEATAIWGNPTSGPAYLPVIFSICDFEHMKRQGHTSIIEFPKKNDAPCDWGQDGNVMPGGFGYIGDGSCTVDLGTNSWIKSYPGNSIPCSSLELSSHIGETILLPVFDACRRKNGGGSDNQSHCPESSHASNHGDYHVYAFAAFVLEGYRLNGDWTDKSLCHSNSNCLKGKFVEYVSLDDAFEYGSAPDTGASLVALID